MNEAALMAPTNGSSCADKQPQPQRRRKGYLAGTAHTALQHNTIRE